jgi:hypothetical protein
LAGSRRRWRETEIVARLNRNDPEAGYDWRHERKAGVIAIFVSMVVFTALWLAIRYYAPAPAGMDELAARMRFTLKCACIATLFCFVTGIEAVAHERLQSAAFDPLQQVETRRLRVNLRYLQNTLEQLVVFIVGLFGLALYSPDGDAMRAVLATTIVWILARLAFWAGYHRSAALRGLGAPDMALALLVLIYVAGRIGFELAGIGGAAAVVGAFLLFEAFLFRVTRGSR